MLLDRRELRNGPLVKQTFLQYLVASCGIHDRLDTIHSRMQDEHDRVVVSEGAFRSRFRFVCDASERLKVCFLKSSWRRMLQQQLC